MIFYFLPLVLPSCMILSCAARIICKRSFITASSMTQTSRRRAKSVESLNCTLYDNPSAELNTCRILPTLTPGGNTAE